MIAALRILLLAVQLVVHAGLHVGDAIAHSAAAVIAETPRLPAELLLGVATVESGFDPLRLSWVAENGKRVTGVWPSIHEAGGGPRFCGALQTMAGDDWALCMKQRELLVAYRTAVRELERWGRHPKVRSTRVLLRVYACGVYGWTTPCRRYDLRVLEAARQLE